MAKKKVEKKSMKIAGEEVNVEGDIIKEVKKTVTKISKEKTVIDKTTVGDQDVKDAKKVSKYVSRSGNSAVNAFQESLKRRKSAKK